MKVSATVLIYPYPWFSERLVHKDVYQFPAAIARALDNEFLVKKGRLITGQELEDQSPVVLRAALLLNTLLLLLSFPALRLHTRTQTPCFVLFHISWPTALLALGARLIWGKRARIVIKTDLNPKGTLAVRGGGSILERFSVRLLRPVADVFVAETSAAAEALSRLIDRKQVVLCHNGIDLTSVPSAETRPRGDDILVVSRFQVKNKGAELYKEVIPQLVSAGFSIHLVGEGAGDFTRQTGLQRHPLVTISEQLQHMEVLRAMMRARVFLSLSLSESFLIAIMEAYAMGCRVISTPVGVAPDLANITSNITIIPFDAAEVTETVIRSLGMEQPDAPARLGGWDDVVEDSGLVGHLIST